jgi:hypothetical protein
MNTDRSIQGFLASIEASAGVVVKIVFAGVLVLVLVLVMVATSDNS